MSSFQDLCEWLVYEKDKLAGESFIAADLSALALEETKLSAKLQICWELIT